MLIPVPLGGLGNVMFELASVYSIAKQTGHSFGIYELSQLQIAHSTVDATQTILSPWLRYRIAPQPNLPIFKEKDGYSPDINTLRKYSDSTHVSMDGYFQRRSYIEPYKAEILSQFPLNPVNDDLSNAYFLHIRRGDYVGNRFHEFDLRDYYRRAIERFPRSAVAHIVSNDIAWCESWDGLADINHRFVEADEVQTLSHMAQCSLGGISANSSFSWWGLYLNTRRPILCMPNRWFPHSIMYQDDYRILEAQSISI